MSLGPHVLVETLTGSASGPIERESSFNAPSVETVNARLEQLGVFRDDSVGSGQSATAMQYQAVDAAAPVNVVAGRAGTIVGMVLRAFDTGTSGAITAGTATARATVGGVAAGDALVLDADTLVGATLFTTPVEFSATDLLGMTLASASLAPTTSRFHGWLLIRWGAAAGL